METAVGAGGVLDPLGQQAPQGQGHLQPAVLLALDQQGLAGAHLGPRRVVGLQPRRQGTLQMGAQALERGREGKLTTHWVGTGGLGCVRFSQPAAGSLAEAPH